MTSPRKIPELEPVVRQFIMPKSGHELSECEDAVGINIARQRFAIADGATEAFDAGNWAKQLAHNWVDIDACLSQEEFSVWLSAQGESLQACWGELHLPWYSEEKARAGSFAAFVGVQLEEHEQSLRWSAIALGDSCLVHCRNGHALKTLPIVSSETFGSTPMLAASNKSTQSLANAHVVLDSGTLEVGDTLLLFTDAIAAWYLKLLEISEIRTRIQFESSVAAENLEDLYRLFETERSKGQIKNDDLAVIQIQV